MMQRRLKLLGMLSCLSVLMAGCQTVSPTPIAATASATCLTVKIVHYSKTDTADTIQQVRQNNAALRSLCPGIK